MQGMFVRFVQWVSMSFVLRCLLGCGVGVYEVYIVVSVRFV